LEGINLYPSFLITQNWHPKNYFPVFRGHNTVIQFFNAPNPQSFIVKLRLVKHAWKNGGLRGLIVFLQSLITSVFGFFYLKLEFVIFRSNFDVLYRQRITLAKNKTLTLNINEILGDLNRDEAYGVYVRAEKGSSVNFAGFHTGTFTVSYLSNHNVAMYRNGIFGRPVNDFNHHRPLGFRSFFPILTNEFVYSNLVIINYSSADNYKHVATIELTLVNTTDGISSKVELGCKQIAANEWIEINIDLLIKENCGGGSNNSASSYIVAFAPGVTCSSIHLVRSRIDQSIVAVEHSRPTHMYVT
jgi:hypothetical protein